MLLTLNSISESQPNKTSDPTVDDFQQIRGLLEGYTNGAHPIIDITDGTKKSYTKHQYKENRLTWSEVEGNYAIMPVRDLVVIDIDEPDSVPDEIRDLPNTLVVESPHGGYHLYYLVDGDIGNGQFEWGEIRSDGWYVMGPGSVIDHDGSCDDDCSLSGEGRYELSKAREPARITPEQLPEQTASEPAQNGQEQYDVDFDEVDANFHIKSRVEKAKNSKHGEQFTALWEGRYRDAGYSDRSTAEAELLCRLAFWMEQNEDAMACAMDLACSEHPRAGSMGPRKWLQRDGVYRQTSLTSAIDTVDNSYSGSTNGYQPEVSAITMEAVLNVLLELRIARKEEIYEHPEVDRKKTQIGEALRRWEDQGLVSRTRSDADGRKIYYYPTGLESSIPKEKRERIGVEAPG